MNEYEYGGEGYNAYGEVAGWKTLDGRLMPTWEELGDSRVGQETQRRWAVAAMKILACAGVVVQVNAGELTTE